MPGKGLLNQLGLSSRRSGLSGYLSDVFKSDRKIETVDASKDKDGNLVYNLKMTLLDDGEPKVQFPAVATISQSTPGVNDKINLSLKLPSKNYGEDRKLEPVDTTAYQGVPNSKRDIERACWSCFDKVGYDQEKFAQWFGADNNMFDFSSGNKNIDRYIHKMSFIYTDDEGNESEVEFRMAAIPDQDSKETVTISFEYPNPKTMNPKDLLAANNKYKGIPNKQDKIIQKVQDFLKATYNIDSIEQMPESVVASADIDESQDTESETPELEEVTKEPEGVDPMKNMTLSFQKVKASTRYDLHLRNITANYDPSQALEDLNLLIQNDEFAESIPVDDIVVYDVTVSDDALDTEVAEMNESAEAEYIRSCQINGFNAILDAAYALHFDATYMGYLAAGANMSEIKSMAGTYNWRTQELIDNVSILMVESNFELRHPIMRMKDIDPTNLHAGCACNSLDQFTTQAIKDVQALINAIELYVCNYSEDIQNQMQQWLRSWKHEEDYNLYRVTYAK